MPAEEPGKLYYSIGEVSRMTELPQSVLRYWETEFDGIRPRKNRAGKRTYRQVEIERILRIKKLLYEDRFTIEGARKTLRSKTSTEHEAPADEPESQAKIQLPAEEIRQGLQEILALLSN